MNPTALSSSEAEAAGLSDSPGGITRPTDRPIGRRRILAADASAQNRDALQRACQFLNLDCDIVGSPDEIPAKLSERHYDLVLADMHMPRMDGLKVALQICSLLPEFETRPRIAPLMGDIGPGSCGGCRFAAVEDCMLRALLPEPLKPCIETLCGDRVSAPQPRPLSLAEFGDDPHYPTLDTQHLDRMIEDGGGLASLGFLQELSAAARRDFLSRRPLLDRACKARDSRALQQVVHGYCGCFSSLGWTLLLDHCMEQSPRLLSGQFTHWESFGPELDRRFAVTRGLMERFIESRRRMLSG